MDGCGATQTHRWPSGEKTVMARSYLAMVDAACTRKRSRADRERKTCVCQRTKRKGRATPTLNPCTEERKNRGEKKYIYYNFATRAQPCGSFGGPACPRARPGTVAARAAGPRSTKLGALYVGVPLSCCALARSLASRSQGIGRSPTAARSRTACVPHAPTVHLTQQTQ